MNSQPHALAFCRQPSFAWKYNTSSQDQAMAPSANFPLDSAEVDGLMGLPSSSAFMRCQSPSSGKTERLSGFKRKHSEDSNSGLSTATNLDSRPSMSFTGSYPQHEALEAQMGSPGISSPWQAIAFSQVFFNLLSHLSFSNLDAVLPRD